MKIIFLLLFFITSVQLLAQDSTCYECCVYKNKFSSGQRIKFYPFDVVDTIKIVSFKYHWNNYHFSDSGLTSDSLIESDILSGSEINELTDILFNNSRKRKTNIGSVTMCFEPRNAILFINKDGKLIENILICFHCNRIELSSDKIYNFDQCS